MKKETREKKFKCEFSEQATNGKEMNCFYFGCLHQIKGDCPILNGGSDVKKD